VEQTFYTKKQKYYYPKIKKVGRLKGLMYIAHCIFHLEVPILVICIQAILCPEEL
jgi:hypothetical protein